MFKAIISAETLQDAIKAVSALSTRHDSRSLRRVFRPVQSILQTRQ
ncbi:MAG: hypothetical protein C5S48_08545 [Candidatus Methanogaster sp.]|nr:MAG: hypothetical protein C5S48_08545 [ANME-2 cluster archaeon]